MVEWDSGPGGIYSRLADLGHGPVRFTEEVATRMPTPEEAGFLRLTDPQPVFNLFRTAFDESGTPVEVCEHVISGDRCCSPTSGPPTSSRSLATPDCRARQADQGGMPRRRRRPETGPTARAAPLS
jgi:UTRA domain